MTVPPKPPLPAPLSHEAITSLLSGLPNRAPTAEADPRSKAIRDLLDHVEAELGPLGEDQSLLLHRDGGVKLLVGPADKSRRYAKAKGALRTMGGKGHFQQHFAHLLPMGPFPLFVDAMVGGGSITLAAIEGRVASRYWLNDLNPATSTFFRVCADDDLNLALRQRLHALLDLLEAMANDQDTLLDYYMALLREQPTDDLVKAARCFTLNRLSFNGHVRFPMRTIKPFTRGSVERLARLTSLREAIITNMDVKALLAALPSGAVVFLDPPYLTNPGRYTDGHRHFDADFDHVQFVSALSDLGARGIRFMLTYDMPVLHDPVLAPMLAEFRQVLCAIKYQNGRGSDNAVEVAIMNY